MKILKSAFITFLTISLFIGCKKEFSLEGGGINLISGTWQFINNTIQYNGNIDSASINNVSGTKVLTLQGVSLTGGENFRIRLYATDSFTTRVYLASLSQSDFDYFTLPKTIFKGDVLAGEFTVTITLLSNNHITGTFSGIAEDSTGAQTQITLGTFTSSIDLSSNGSGQGGTTSVGTLGASPDTCTPVTLSGNFTRGIPLSASNTAQVQVNVTTPGTFIISTNNVNGVNFSKTGTFTASGVQNVILVGSGTPQNQGDQYFTVTYGTSHCIFKVTFLPGTGPVADYFPTTTNSFWVYGLEGGTTSDSMMTQVISYAPSFGGNKFASITLDNIPASGNPDTSYYRKSGNDYSTFLNVSNFFPFDDPVYGQYIFLNDSVLAGTVITSPDFNGNVQGFAVTGFIQATISQKAVPVTLGSLNFPDVIKVTYQYYTTASPISIGSEERWFARGIGLIYDNVDNLNIYDIGRYTVL